MFEQLYNLMAHFTVIADIYSYLPAWLKNIQIPKFDLQYPELLLLGIPAWYLYHKFGRQPGTTGWLRFTILVILLITLCGPRMNLSGEGQDIIIVADRSRSMPHDAEINLKELIQNLENNRGKGDRVGLVTMGMEPYLEFIPKADGKFTDFKFKTNIDGSDLNAALETALNATDNQYRPTRILVMSDGEYTGPSPLLAARRAREISVPIDFRRYERIKEGDIAVEGIMLPETVNPREPFQFSVNIYAGKPITCKLTIKREGEIVSSSDRNLQVGYQQLIFRDVVEAPGLWKYSAELEVPNDPLPENNTGIGMLRVEADSRVLILSKDGKEGNLARELRSTGINVDVAKGEDHPVTLDSLDPYRVVILENIPARTFGRLKMERLAQYVEELGGGLMMTGGEMSFGSGGYFKSPLEEILPVSMEMRKEHRKTSIALAIVLDRSGSMSMPVSGGKQKMDLADLGTAECIRMLSPGDSVAVIAVDSTAHVIQPLVDIDDPEPIAKKALTIKSMGGGIFVYEALLAAGKQLAGAEQATKHIILFSDAQDSEEPGDYVNLLKKYEVAGITVSVIGLGTDKDVDADLLKKIAKLGQGNIMFTEDAQELPRLFTEDTMSVARKSFLTKDEKTNPAGFASRLLPDSRLFGDITGNSFPNTDGFNLSYLKPDATMSVVTTDEFNSPLVAGWYRGLGRVIALCLEVDGKYTGQFGDWDKYGETLVTYTRWLLGKEELPGYYLQLQQQGQEAIATVELDPNRPQKEATIPPEFLVIPPGDGKTETLKPSFVWTSPDTLEARFKLDSNGTYRTLVKIGNRDLIRGPVVSLPYSPEFTPRIDLPPGKVTLEEMSQISGGKERTDVVSIFENPPHSKIRMSLYPYFLMATIGLLILEIAGRRLSLWNPVRKETELDDGKVTWGEFVYQTVQTNLASLGKIFSRKSKAAEDTMKSKIPAVKASEIKPQATPETSKPVPPAQPVAPPVDIYAAAKSRAKKRL